MDRFFRIHMIIGGKNKTGKTGAAMQQYTEARVFLSYRGV
jgi:hypothetical protein